ncbi:ABC transporter permease [Streptomyces sp. NPDC050145]|uniref:ABC transporter permease n=1 Tax=Streptomyces sp. NPDC050145 TaxID=3365602 RepID=UPI0037B00186
MSALTFSPRTGLTWTVLKLHQIALWLWVAYVALCAGVQLWLIGPGTSGLGIAGRCVAGVANSCVAQGPTAGAYHFATLTVDVTLAAVPLAVALYIGGLVLGRELERGTAQLTWSQSVTPVRWLTAKLALPALALTLGTGLLIALRQAVVARAPGLTDNQWYAAGSFDTLGTVAVALPLLGLACGALGALLHRRALPAAATSGVLLLVLSTLLGQLRPHLWTTRTVTGSVEQGYRFFAGQLTGEGAITGSGARVEDPMCVDDRACLTEHNITGFYREGHPPAHFWPMQLMETGVVLAVVSALTYAAFWLLRRRVPSAK